MKTTEAPPDIIKDFFLEENPNPERIGCPPGVTLQAAAENRLPLNDPARLHMGRCSECFAEYRGYRLDWKNKQAAHRRVIGWAVAAVLLLAVGGGALALRHRLDPRANLPEIAINSPAVAGKDAPAPVGDSRGKEETPPVAPPRQEEPSLPRKPPHGHSNPNQPSIRDEAIPAALDLSPEDPAQRQRKRLLKLQAAELNLSLVLPGSSDKGKYQVQLTADAEGQKVIAHGAGEAVKQNGKVQLSVQLPLQKVAPGDYFLSVVPAQSQRLNIPGQNTYGQNSNGQNNAAQGAGVYGVQVVPRY